MTHVASDDITRIRPGRILVRIVVRPHAVVTTPPREQTPSHVIIKKCRVYLLVEVFAGRFTYGEGTTVAMTAKGLVALPEPKGHPADLVGN